MLSKEKMFKITSVVMESGCKKYILYRDLGWLRLILVGSRYSQVGKFDSMRDAMSMMNTLYQVEANSCTKSKEVQVWPKKEE